MNEGIEKFIVGMLTNHKQLPLDRIHNMLKMFSKRPSPLSSPSFASFPCSNFLFFSFFLFLLILRPSALFLQCSSQRMIRLRRTCVSSCSGATFILIRRTM